MSWGAIVVGGIGLIMNAQNQANNRDVAEGIAEDALALSKDTAKLLDKVTNGINPPSTMTLNRYTQS